MKIGRSFVELRRVTQRDHSLEVGCGTGQLKAPAGPTGIFRIVCVEPGASLAVVG